MWLGGNTTMNDMHNKFSAPRGLSRPCIRGVRLSPRGVRFPLHVQHDTLRAIERMNTTLVKVTIP